MDKVPISAAYDKSVTIQTHLAHNADSPQLSGCINGSKLFNSFKA